MKITHSYRNEIYNHCDTDICFSFSGDGLNLTQRAWSDGNGKVYNVVITDAELLELSKKALARLSKISGIEYRAFAKNAATDRWFPV